MLPEEKARVKIDKQLTAAGWDIVARDEYIPFNASVVKEALSERKSKEGVHNYLMKELHDNKKVTELYKKIKPLLKDKS